MKVYRASVLFFLVSIYGCCCSSSVTLCMKNEGNDMKTIGVIGEGAWGTAISSLLAENGYNINLWCCDETIARQINQEHKNDRYMPGFTLSPHIVAFVDLKDVANHDWVFISTPTKYFRNIVAR